MRKLNNTVREIISFGTEQYLLMDKSIYVQKTKKKKSDFNCDN